MRPVRDFRTGLWASWTVWKKKDGWWLLSQSSMERRNIKEVWPLAKYTPGNSALKHYIGAGESTEILYGCWECTETLYKC